MFMEDRYQGDGRRPRSGDRQTVIDCTFIRGLDDNEDGDGKLHLRVRRGQEGQGQLHNIVRQTLESLLSTLSTIEIVIGTGWEELTEVTKECRLIYRMLDIGPTKGFRP